jgi:HAE1 family hydrophobic/amphiphilic exporter-1/multidrug efflux pump
MVVLILNNLKSELAPLEDRSSVRFTATAPEGTSFSYMSNIADSIANYLYDSVPSGILYLFVLRQDPITILPNRGSDSYPRIREKDHNLRLRQTASG